MCLLLACDFNSLQSSAMVVILIPYNPFGMLNLSYWMLLMMIPGARSPNVSIDVYLQPLIDEFKVLWEEGVKNLGCKGEEEF
jgi:hypothetical protein